MKGFTQSCHQLVIQPEYRVKDIHTTLTLLEPTASGINAPWYAQLGEREFGYFKHCANTDRAMEELEVVLALLGRCLGVSTADTYLLMDEKGEKIGSFSVDVAECGEEFRSANAIKESWLRGRASFPKWVLRADEIHRTARKIEPMPGYQFSLVDECGPLCELLRFVYELISDEGKHNLAQSFADMVLFDCLIWQKDRTMDNFGIVRGRDGLVGMAALFDSATIVMPGLEEETNGFCNILTHRTALARAVETLFPSEYACFVERLRNFVQTQGAQFASICQRFLVPDYQKKMMNRLDVWRELEILSEV